jgi:hypothetical protein
LYFIINSSNKSGGVAIFIKQFLHLNPFDLSFIKNVNSDLIGCTFNWNQIKYILIGIYNHNNNTIKYLSDIFLTIKNKISINDNIIIIGDFNINFLLCNENDEITDFVDVLYNIQFY